MGLVSLRKDKKKLIMDVRFSVLCLVFLASSTYCAKLSCAEIANLAPNIPGTYVPQCKEDGSYTAMQCHFSTGHCWCVDEKNGREHYGTKEDPVKENLIVHLVNNPCRQAVQQACRAWRTSSAFTLTSRLENARNSFMEDALAMRTISMQKKNAKKLVCMCHNEKIEGLMYELRFSICCSRVYTTDVGTSKC